MTTNVRRYSKLLLSLTLQVITILTLIMLFYLFWLAVELRYTITQPKCSGEQGTIEFFGDLDFSAVVRLLSNYLSK